jgi:hypothetical protein
MSTRITSFSGNPEGAIPPLPDPIPVTPASAESEALDQPVITQPPIVAQPPIIAPLIPLPLRSVRCGCYLINYTPTSSPLVSYDGTLRVECHSNGRTASGDLYQRLVFLISQPGFPPRPPLPVLAAGPNPAAGIPIFARSRYRYYVRVTQILESFTVASSFILGFELYRFTAPNTWVNEGAFKAQMTWTPAPPGYPSSGDYLVGIVKNSGGTVVGKLTMGWVSKYYRKATVEIDRVSVSEAPLNNGSGVDWKSVFDEVGWQLTLDVSDSNVAQPSGDSWSNAEMHAAMLARRDASNLDAEWRYHVLAVKLLDATPRGIMYDAGGTDSNNVPREGVGISSHWVIPNASPWGTVKGMRFGTAAAPYFRTAVHEVGHALGLFHNTVDNGFMNTTDVIASSCPATFPSCIKWSYAADDLKRLRHYPDVFVRPGGTAFGTASTATPPISPTDLAVDAPGLELRVSPLLESVPLGAPVRVNLELVNTSKEPQHAPANLSLKSDFVRGSVVDPSGSERTFSPLVLCVEDHPMQTLEPGKGLSQSLTLLRGKQGALFPTPGVHRIVVEVHWEVNGLDCQVVGEANVMVTSAVDEDHAQAALKVLSTPDALLTLVLGGDHLTDGVEAIQAGLKTPVLQPHFAFVEAKRLADRFGKRKANLKAAADLITDATVMSPAEVKKAATLVQSEGAESAARKSLAKTLKKKAGALKVAREIKDIVDSL